MFTMNGLILCFILLSFSSILTVPAQIGKNCHNDSECHDQLSWECFQNVCQCKPRHIQNGGFCFPEVHYGEQCWFMDQCVDHRQVCKGIDNFGGMRCSCDQYHEYNETLSQCEPKKNLTSLLEEKYNSFEDISGQAKSTFYGILVCGLFITVVGFFCMIVAFFYCCRMHITDKKLDKEVNSLIVTTGGKPGQSFHPSKTLTQKRRQLNDAAIDPIIECDLII